MHVDRYTKIVLTLILAALTYLCVAVTPVGTPVNAQEGVTPTTRVILVGWEGEDKKVYPISDLHGIPVHEAANAGNLRGTMPASLRAR